MTNSTPQSGFSHTTANGTRTSLLGSASLADISDDTATAHADPRSRSAQGWSARKAVLASRGVVDGPDVAEADAALSWWRVERRLSAEVAAGHMDAANAERVLDQLADHKPTR